MSPNTMHDPLVPHVDGAHHRREAALRSREIRPLLTRVPLLHDRERRPAAQPPRRRRRITPTTPALTFDPKRNHVPSGRQDPPASPLVHSRPSTSESSSSYDEQRATVPDREIHDPLGYDPQNQRPSPECSSIERSTSSYPDTPCTDVNDLGSVQHDFYDSPMSYTSSSSPAPSDQSPSAAEFTYYPHHVQVMYAYGGQGYTPQPVVHQDPYGYGPCQDRPAQGYPVQYPEAGYGRPAAHGIPAYPENNGYSCLPGCRY